MYYEVAQLCQSVHIKLPHLMSEKTLSFKKMINKEYTLLITDRLIFLSQID